MAASAGRLLRIKRGSTAVAGARTENLTVNNEPIDITDKDDSSWRTLLADAGVRSVEADIEGVLIDSTYPALAVGAASSLQETWKLEVASIGDFDGDFHLSSFAITGELDGAVTFTANIVSTGAITFT